MAKVKLKMHQVGNRQYIEDNLGARGMSLNHILNVLAEQQMTKGKNKKKQKRLDKLQSPKNKMLASNDYI